MKSVILQLIHSFGANRVFSFINRQGKHSNFLYSLNKACNVRSSCCPSQSYTQDIVSIGIIFIKGIF